MNKRQFSKLDEFIIHIDNLLGEFSKSGDREIQLNLTRNLSLMSKKKNMSQV